MEADQLKRRKEIYETLHPETRQGTAQALSMNKAIGNNVSDTVSLTFAEDTATKTGVTDRTIRGSIQLAKTFTPEQKEVLKSANIPQTDATKLARKPAGRPKLMTRTRQCLFLPRVRARMALARKGWENAPAPQKSLSVGL